MSSESSKRPRRLAAMITTTIGGVTVIGFTYYTEAIWGWQGVSPSLLVNLGSALLLVAALFLLERRFAEDVAEQAQQATRAELREEGRRRGTPVDKVQDQVKQRLQQGTQAQGDVIATLQKACPSGLLPLHSQR